MLSTDRTTLVSMPNEHRQAVVNGSEWEAT
jgi:hypothetical protein